MNHPTPLSPPAHGVRHLAIIMDGNGRWAKKRFMPRIAGHRAGVEALKRTLMACGKAGIESLTVFAFSSENWQRPSDEVSGLMEIFVKTLAKELAQLTQDGVRLSFVGERSNLSAKVLKSLQEAEQATSYNHRLKLNICFNYGGRWDIVQAAQHLTKEQTPITEASLSQALALSDNEPPDLLIRTGGEMRISNFLIWQIAYSELYFSDQLWPDFDEASLHEALKSYGNRERRFGLISEQITPPMGN